MFSRYAVIVAVIICTSHSCAAESSADARPDKDEIHQKVNDPLSSFERSLASILAELSLAVDAGKEEIMAVKPKVDQIVETARDSECGRKIERFASSAREQAAEIAGAASEKAVDLGKHLDERVRQRRSAIEQLDLLVSVAEQKLEALETSGEASDRDYYKALWNKRLLQVRRAATQSHNSVESALGRFLAPTTQEGNEAHEPPEEAADE